MIPTKSGKTAECPKCKTRVRSDDTVLKEKIQKKETKKVAEANIETYPKIAHECPKCGNKEAYFWTSQTRAADEPETEFYRCTKCKYTERDYS